MTIRKAAPDAEETINYQIPTFTLKGNLVHFAAFKEHIGFYPAPTGIDKFKKELSVYEGAKGSVTVSIRSADSFRPDRQNCEVQGKGKFGKGRSKREEKMRST